MQIFREKLLIVRYVSCFSRIMTKKKVIAFIILILKNYLLIEVLCFVDFNSVPKNLSFISANSKKVKAKTNYKLTWINFSTVDASAELFVSLPPKLRLRQQAGQDTRLTIDVINGNATLRIKEISGMHIGFYTALKVLKYNISNDSYVDQRKDFYIAVTDLGKEGVYCYEDSACLSNHCIKYRCVCNREKPVPFQHNCYSAEPIGSSCYYSKQCEFIAGFNSECNHRSMCGCEKNSFPINIPFYGKYCIEPKGYDENCTFSEECQAIGANRYCSHDYKCRCIPGYTYKTGSGCRNTAISHCNNISSLYLNSSLTILLAFIITFRMNVFF